jgi:hypothetical protein
MNSINLFRTLSIPCALFFAACNTSADPILSPDDAKFLHDQAAKIVQKARIAPGEQSGGRVNTTKTIMLMPDSQQAYIAQWVRDSNMDLGADFVPASEVLGWIKLIAATVPETGPNVNVPAYSVPDHINLDGTCSFFPGDFNLGAAQKGIPPLDDAFFFIFDSDEYARMTGSTAFLKDEVTIGSGSKWKIGDLCFKVLEQNPNDPATGLSVIHDVTEHQAHDFGFCDAEWKSGKVLFTSLLRYDAAHRLDRMLRTVDDVGGADWMHREAEKIKANIVSTFYHDSPQHPGEGWLHSATEVGNQPDVWGSAYAIDLGILDPDTQKKVGASLVRSFREHTEVKDGCVSEVLENDPANPHGWQNSVMKFGEYQNGAYWGTGTGYYLVALSKVDPAAAKAMAAEYVAALRANMRPDGMTQAWEWFNPATKQYVHPLYCASVALPYCQLKEAGLLP